MRRILFAFLLLLSTNLSAQTLVGDRLRLNTGPCILRSGSGSPEGVLVGSICDMYVNTANGVWYVKWTGTATNTGWGVGHNTNAVINGNETISGFVGTPTYVSQLTGWRIDNLGAGDFRYLFTDELHAKSFIADLEQALAGGQIICKSVTSLGANFTNPAAAGTATLTVRDLPSAPNVATFAANDWVGIRTFSRSAFGSLTIGETYGVVTSYADQANGVQTWTFTRGTGANGGGLSTSTVINIDAIVIDYGVSGNGCHEINAIDGAAMVNSPYSQTWTWTTSPISANRVLRTRVGNLNGITAVANEYGAILGTYGASSAAFVRASSSAVEMHNVNLSMYDGATQTFLMNPSVPSFALGAAVPSAYGTGTGVWMGKDSGTYKWRVGNPAGNRVTWDGTTLSVVGDGGGVTNINGANIQTGTISAAKLTVGSGQNLLRNSDCSVSTGGWTGFTNAGAPGGTFSLATSLSPWRLNDISGTCYITLSLTPGVGTESQGWETVMVPVVAGNKYEASAYFGVHRAGNTQVLIQWYNAAGASLGVSTGSTCTAANAGGTQLNGYCRSGIIAAAPAGAINAQFMVDQIYTGGGGGANPYMFWVHAFFGEALANQTELSPWGPPGMTEIVGDIIKTGTITANKISVASLSAISANIGTIVAGSISGVTATFGGGLVTLNNSGIQIGAGAGFGNSINWTDGGNIHSSGGIIVVHGASSVQLQFASSSATINSTYFSFNNRDLGATGDRWRDVYLGGTVYTGLAGGAGIYACISAAGVLFSQVGGC